MCFNLVFLVSGNGGNLKFFDLALKHGIIDGISIFVIADRNCGAVDYAKRVGIPVAIINYTVNHRDELMAALLAIAPDIIVTNWHKILDADTVNEFKGKLINLHYSLLPSFGGLIGQEPIRNAYSCGCKFIGPTCHYVDEFVDSGMIIAQSIFATDVSIEHAINIMFKRGCLTLINSIELLLSVSIHKCNLMHSDSQWFYPRLGFDDKLYSDSFWRELSLL
ncbi:formyltransferase family protein [Aeromonas veronii]|uniref:formyltransferase family protein n=1 Tax=Aeromonas veronii TaxID=654 RepID=UPI000B59A484|nr:formyltransferase family protein [Aeromonas veronii]